MSKVRAGSACCAVVGCVDEHRSLFISPTSVDLNTKWKDFIFGGKVPTTTVKSLYVCAHHFTPDCFQNKGQYDAGFASHLRLKKGSLPTLRDESTGLEDESKPFFISKTRHAACQTDPPKTQSVGTQLSRKTLHPKFMSKGVQATVSCKEFCVGTSAKLGASSTTPMERPSKRSRLDLEEAEEEEEEEEVEDDGNDEDYDPLKDRSSMEVPLDHDSFTDSVTALTERTGMTETASSPTHKIKKYIVYETCLMELFEVCPVCQSLCYKSTRKLGTFLSVHQLCPHCQFSRHWKSQPLLGSTPAGNLQLSAAVYLSGSSFSKTIKVFNAMQVQAFQYDTFRRHARMFIEPAVVHMWKTSQDSMLHRLRQDEKVILGGNMKADSPGNSTKYGSYYMMDLKTDTVVDIQLVQSNEVGGSSHMEKEGLNRSLALLKERGVTLDCIVTDRHPQIQKYLRENNIPHFCDARLLEKGISKKLDKIAQKKDGAKLEKWKSFLRNHIYWTAATSQTGPERVAKWTSILNHVQDIHTHEDPLFPHCLHPLRQTKDKEKWLTAATPVFCELEKLLTSKKILKDVANLSPHHPTSSLETFRSVILRYVPNSVAFPFLGKLCRLFLAAFHHNENAGRLREALCRDDCPQTTEGEHVHKPRFVDELMALIFEKVFVDPMPFVEEVLRIPIPEDLSAQS